MTPRLAAQEHVPVATTPAQPGTARRGPFPGDLAQIDAKVAALLSQMTLEEKIGQLAQYSRDNATGPDNVKIDHYELAAHGQVGSMFSMTSAAETNAIQREAVEKTRLKIPLLFGQDVIHGFRTIYPVPLALSASWDAKLVEDCARMAAVEASSAGIRWTFSPMVDIARDARWGRITEGSGEDPFLGEAMAAAATRGYQGKDLSDPTTMLACAKHFVAYGGAEGGRDYNTVDVSERTLREVYLPPFKAALDAGALTFMSAFNVVSGVPASANHHTLTDILRGEWNFEGMVVSDWGSVRELIPHGIALDGKDAAAKGLLAGVDMDMQNGLYGKELAGLIKDGRVPVAAVDQAVTRVLRLKFALGLFDHPYTDEARSGKAILSPENLALAQRAAEGSFVLLKNDPVQGQPLLPLTGDKTVALIGQLADSQEDMLGAWSLQGQAKDVVTLQQALSDRLKDKLIYAEGVTPKQTTEAGFEAALVAAKKADVVVMALGETHRMSGEAASRAHLGLPGRQLELLKAVMATGKPVVLVLFNGRPLALPWEAANVPAILEAWFPGVQAGPALARTLLGEASPAGKLTASFPRSVGQEPLYYNHLNTGRPAPKTPEAGFYSGYIDEENTPQFPFGWGLSYTQFEYSPTQITTEAPRASDLNAEGKIVVRGTVKNTGARPGTETVQLYIGERGTSVARPVRELKGFERVTLAPGESRQVQFTLTKRELAFLNVDMKQTVEPCELTVWVAPHAQGGTPAKTLIAP